MNVETAVEMIELRAHLKLLLIDGITTRLREEIVEQILPKPSIDELEKMIEDAEKEGHKMPDLLPTGELCITKKKPVFASDLADAALSAIEGGGFQIMRKPEGDGIIYIPLTKEERMLIDAGMAEGIEQADSAAASEENKAVRNAFLKLKRKMNP